jgi:hypothetical protein
LPEKKEPEGTKSLKGQLFNLGQVTNAIDIKLHTNDI